MNKFNTFKFIQMTLLIIFSAFSLFFLLKTDVKQYVFSSEPATILFIIIWVLLISGFIFILVDISIISSIKLGYHSLYGVAYTDPLSGIPNRFSCDTIIEKYYDAPLPDNIGCLMIDLINLSAVNTQYDHKTGNKLLRDFSAILSKSSLSLCFVGRNGGNKFLAIFENCTPEKVDVFLSKVAEQVAHYNTSSNSVAIDYKYGLALNSEEHTKKINLLISLANDRIYGDSEADNGEK